MVTLVNEGDTWSFPTISPDFTLLEITDHLVVSHLKNRRTTHSSGGIGLPLPKSSQPRGRDQYLQKKVLSKQLSRKLWTMLDFIYTTLSAIFYRIAHFWLGILRRYFDRDGVQFSPVHDIWSPVFIRVVRCLTCDMSPVELGQDPTVRILSDAQAVPWQKKAVSLGLQSTQRIQFPTYAITMGKGNRCWYTLGVPIWSSLSLLGRGTVVWRVCDSNNPNKLLVLKNAWRSSGRLPESTIYESIIGKHPGVANYEFGDDVVFPGHSDRLICVNNLRCEDWKDEENTAATPVLHRLLVSTYGRPLWDCTSELELLKGLRAALKGAFL
jgi:hypothetical protein